MKNIEDLLNETLNDEIQIQDLTEQNKRLLERIENFKECIKDLLKDLNQINYDLESKNKFIEEVLNLESLLLENDNKYEDIENLLNKTFLYDTIQDLEEQNKYLLKKVKIFKKGIKDLLKNWKKANYDLKMKNKLTQVFQQLENSLLSFKDDSNDNKYEELENLKQENHRLSQNLILKEKELEDFKIDNKNYEKQNIDLNKEKQDLTEQLNKVTRTQSETKTKLDTVIKEKQDLTEQLNKVTRAQSETKTKLDTVIKEKQDLTDEVQSLKETETSNEKQINDLNKTKQDLTEQLDTVTKEKQDLTEQLNKVTRTQSETKTKLDTVIKEKQDLTDEVQSLKETETSNEKQINDLNKAKQDLTDEVQSLKETETSNEKQINDLNKTKQDLTEQLDTVTKEKQDLTDEIEESILITNSNYYQKLNYISEPIIISKHKDNNWNIETLPNIENERIKKTILLNIEENKILNNLIEQKINITIIFCKKTKKFKEAFFIDKYQNKKIINVENDHQKILEKLNYKIRTEMANSLTKSDINKINNFNNQKQPIKSPCLTQEELKNYQNQGAVPKHYI